MRYAHTAIFLLIAANGFYADIAYGLHDPRWNLPMSPVLALVALVAARTIWIAPPGSGIVSALGLSALAGAALVPSSSAAWLSLLVVSAFGVAFDAGRRLAHHLPLALAATQVWKC